MAKSNTRTAFWGELFAVRIYKQSQGRITRQLTGLALAAIVILGAWSASLGPLSSYDTPIRTGVPVAISLVGVWVAFRLVNYPPFADFLISVEGEMDKVSWASWPELYRATIVVILTMVFLGAVLYTYDLIWYNILSALRVLRI